MIYKFILFAVLLSLSDVCAQDCEKSFIRAINESKGKIYIYPLEAENISFVKIISSGYTNYYLTVKQTGRSVKSPLKGVSVLLGDQSKIERPDSPVTIEAHKPGIPEKGRYLFSS